MLNLNDIQLDDNNVWNLISSGNTMFCFQIDSPLGRLWCKRIQPHNIRELSDVIALIRPACLQAKMGDPPKNITQRYSDRKHGIEKIDSIHPILDDLLKDSYSLLLYQEQTLMLSQKLAGFSLKTANELRVAIGKKQTQLMSDIEQQFIDGCTNNNIVSKEIGQEIFDWIKKAARYQFNLSHSVSYAINSYRTAYCKYYYPLEFFTACLRTANSHQKPFEYVKQCVLDAHNNNIEIVIPDIRDKKIEPYIKNQKYVSFGLSNIKGIGESALRSLFLVIQTTEEQLGKPIQDFKWTDYLFFLADNINSSVTEGLIYSGALDYFRKSRSEMFFEFEKFALLTKGEKKWLIEKHTISPFNSLLDAIAILSATKKNGGGCHNQKRADFCIGLAESIRNPSLNIKDSPYFVSMMEEKYLGASISCVKYDGTELSDMANYTCEQVNRGIGGQNISLAVEILRFREYKIKKGDSAGKNMAFIDIFDKTGSLNETAVIFAEKWEEIRNSFDEKASYFIVCNRSKKNSLIIENIQKIC